MRRFVLLVLAPVLLVSAAIPAAYAQAATAPPLLAACGSDSTTFGVSRGKTGTSSPAPADGQATVYVIEVFDIEDKGRLNRPTVRQGLNGAWIGATQGFTYLSANVDPGRHHLCSRWQSHLGRLSNQVSLNSFDAVPGGRYYFRAQIVVEGGATGIGAMSVDLERLSDDEGRFLLSEAAPAISKPKS